jgi:hypothetical protein
MSLGNLYLTFSDKEKNTDHDNIKYPLKEAKTIFEYALTIVKEQE